MKGVAASLFLIRLCVWPASNPVFRSLDGGFGCTSVLRLRFELETVMLTKSVKSSAHSDLMLAILVLATSSVSRADDVRTRYVTSLKKPSAKRGHALEPPTSHLKPVEGLASWKDHLEQRP